MARCSDEVRAQASRGRVDNEREKVCVSGCLEGGDGILL